MAFLTVVDRTIAYHDSGETALPAVLLAHPLGMNQDVWEGVVAALRGRFRCVTWDLPGHGASTGLTAAVTPEHLTADALALADALGLARFHFVGTSVGGVVGQQLLRQAPERLRDVVLTNTGAVIGTPDNWHARAARVRQEGLVAMADEIVPRWFTEAFVQGNAAAYTGWKVQLTRTDGESYARLCEMLAESDFSGQLRGVTGPVRLLGGREDLSTPPDTLKALASQFGDARLEVLEDIAHVPSVEVPEAIAKRLRAWLGDEHIGENGVSYVAGLETRKQVLGDEHVARSSEHATTLDAPFQNMITRMAWGELWGNEDLSRTERSMITLAVLAALGRDGELELHLKTAQRIGLSEAQLRQALMHVAIYAGVPAANHAFSMAKKLGWGNTL
ncbi:alpha/beta fold hydrolase [Chromohalobacter sp. 48-RD10]|uniref:bifunctional 3-oxoadipate enol-lactonase/4-carboxymuconolactone decarboxylase PcaDC n=1 Tax=Chromohalobacter sp. 48-RD10 TaxID=2994063 RepID=UPI0024691184|nr:alpha/beta fold hydrolase [Chromohalobacter sp. 48-RD10]